MSKSKFEFDIFYNDEEQIFAVNRNKYTKQQADELFVEQTEIPLEEARTSIGYVYYAIGMMDGERINGYWFDECPRGRNPIECFAYRWYW